MAEDKKKRGMGAYSEAVTSKLYEKQSGLVGKYDNVRRYWEDEITRLFLRTPLTGLLEHCRASLRRLRILDLGCGSADGYELLTGIRQRESGLQEVEVALLSPDVISQYLGVDLSEDLLTQAQGLYGHDSKMSFRKGDFTRGLPLKGDEKPCDLYFTSFGTFSHHNEDETAINLLAEIAERTEDYALVVCDWIGRYSYEWQTLWTNDLSEIRNMDYVISYIYDEEERKKRRRQLDHLTLRLICRQEAEEIVRRAEKRSKTTINTLRFFDRATFTGRHMDTREYNPYAQPIRQAINSLHETNNRTDLTALLVNYHRKEGFDFLNEYFEYLQVCWNTLVTYVETLLQTYNHQQRDFVPPPETIPASYPKALREMMEKMKSVVKSVGWLDIGLPRERIIEPQLGYSLRYLASQMQQGQGCAHGMVGIFEIDKRK